MRSLAIACYPWVDVIYTSSLEWRGFLLLRESGFAIPSVPVWCFVVCYSEPLCKFLLIKLLMPMFNLLSNWSITQTVKLDLVLLE